MDDLQIGEKSHYDPIVTQHVRSCQHLAHHFFVWHPAFVWHEPEEGTGLGMSGKNGQNISFDSSDCFSLFHHVSFVAIDRPPDVQLAALPSLISEKSLLCLSSGQLSLQGQVTSRRSSHITCGGRHEKLKSHHDAEVTSRTSFFERIHCGRQ